MERNEARNLDQTRQMSLQLHIFSIDTTRKSRPTPRWAWSIQTLSYLASRSTNLITGMQSFNPPGKWSLKASGNAAMAHSSTTENVQHYPLHHRETWRRARTRPSRRRALLACHGQQVRHLRSVLSKAKPVVMAHALSRCAAKELSPST